MLTMGHGLVADPYEVIRLFPELLPQQSLAHEDDHRVRLQDRDLENGLLALIEYLTEVNITTNKGLGSIYEIKVLRLFSFTKLT